jgi:hypothetical protein
MTAAHLEIVDVVGFDDCWELKTTRDVVNGLLAVELE